MVSAHELMGATFLSMGFVVSSQPQVFTLY